MFKNGKKLYTKMIGPANKQTYSGTRNKHQVPEETTEALIAKYQECPSDYLKNLIVERELPYVRDIAKRVKIGLPRHVELDDIISYGAFGLLSSITNYDPQIKVSFRTFSSKRIEGAMKDGMRKLDPVSRLGRSRERKINVINEETFKRTGIYPTREEIKNSLPNYEKKEEKERIIKDSSPPRVSYFEEIKAGNMYAEDICPALSVDSEIASKLNAKDFMQKVVSGLTPIERMIIKLYYEENMTLKKIAKASGCSESRVSQIHSLIIDRLRRRHGLKEQLEELMVIR